jgi:hypothetical protein
MIQAGCCYVILLPVSSAALLFTLLSSSQRRALTPTIQEKNQTNQAGLTEAALPILTHLLCYRQKHFFQACETQLYIRDA